MPREGRKLFLEIKSESWLPVSKRLIGHSSSSPWLSPLVLRVLFLCWSRVSRRGMTTDRNVLVPSWGQLIEDSLLFDGFCGLFDFRNSTAVLRLTIFTGSVRVEVATITLFSEGITSEERPFRSEVESVSPSNLTFFGHFSGLGSMGFSVGGSQGLSEFFRSGTESEGSSFGGNDLSPVMTDQIFNTNPFWRA